MEVRGIYSFNGGRETVEANKPAELAEVYRVIETVDASQLQTKVSAERGMKGRQLFSPPALNAVSTQKFSGLGWSSHREYCDYPTQYYVGEDDVLSEVRGAFREMDYVKNRLGIEVQFGKYAFMVYNVAAKMTIFRNLNVIDYGIEIVPLKKMADQMSSGVSYFEQFVWDLEQRGVSNIDVPVLILGLMP